MNMKKFYNEKDLAEYLNASKQYINDEIHDFLGCQGSEIFESENDIVSIDSFKNEGFEINGFNVYIASVSSSEDKWKQIYCVDILSGLIGKKWGELSAELKEDLLSNCNPVDNMSETVKEGDCIIDFLDYEYVSVLGAVKDGEVVIDDEAIIYDTRG